MDRHSEWKHWLAEADSELLQTPPGYDHDADERRVHELHKWLASRLPGYRLKSLFGMFQDGTGSAAIRVNREESGTDARDDEAVWIVLSRFGRLATITRWGDPALLSKLECLLREAALKYIPYVFVAANAYDGKCAELVGGSYANRFFSIAPEFALE